MMGYGYHPKLVEQFSDKINCVTLHLVGYVLEYYYDAWTHEHAILLINLSTYAGPLHRCLLFRSYSSAFSVSKA